MHRRKIQGVLLKSPPLNLLSTRSPNLSKCLRLNRDFVLRKFRGDNFSGTPCSQDLVLNRREMSRIIHVQSLTPEVGVFQKNTQNLLHNRIQVGAYVKNLFRPPWHSERGCRLEIIVDQYLCKSDLKPLFWKCFNADNFYFYADWRISNNIFHFITFEKSKTTCPFNGNEASRLSYLTGLLTKLPGDHIPLL